MYTRDTRLFQKARISFSVGCEVFPAVVEHHQPPDSANEHARPVPILLHHNIGRCVNVELFFDSKWLLISEVQFDSEPVPNPPPPEVPLHPHLPGATLTPSKGSGGRSNSSQATSAGDKYKTNRKIPQQSIYIQIS